MSKLSRTMKYSVLVGAGLLAGSLAVQAADIVAPAPAAAQTPPAVKAVENPRETVEQRITNLHASLNITAGEEANWNGVTKSMRDNAVAMEKLAADQSARDPATMTAVDDLKIYEKFSQAHVDGLKSLTASFQILYQSMPDAQKKIADKVFQDSRHRDGPHT
jgi:hypothetical protein